MAIAILPALLLSAAALPAAEQAAVDALVRRIYAPYADPAMPPGLLDAPIYSARTAALLARWRKVTPADEPDRLSDGDWFCQCQDWEPAAFRLAITRRERLRSGAARVSVRFALGGGATRTARLVFVREGGEWRVDDLFTPDMPRGLGQTIRETIAEDEALARAAGR